MQSSRSYLENSNKVGRKDDQKYGSKAFLPYFSLQVISLFKIVLSKDYKTKTGNLPSLYEIGYSNDIAPNWKNTGMKIYYSKNAINDIDVIRYFNEFYLLGLAYLHELLHIPKNR